MRSLPTDAFQYMDIAPAFREQVSKYGTDRMALPLGGSALVLVYRRDAFSRPGQSSTPPARPGSRCEPPATWTQLDALARFFQGRDWDGDGSPDHGIAAVLGQDPEGLGDATFLARAASLGQHRDQYLVPLRCRCDGPADRFAAVRRGPPRRDRLEGLGSSRHGEASTRRPPARRFAKARWPC